jgi:hypothetical protein
MKQSAHTSVTTKKRKRYRPDFAPGFFLLFFLSFPYGQAFLFAFLARRRRHIVVHPPTPPLFAPVPNSLSSSESKVTEEAVMGTVRWPTSVLNAGSGTESDFAEVLD